PVNPPPSLHLQHDTTLLSFAHRLPTPRSTLFPYTTLFRSARLLDTEVVGGQREKGIFTLIAEATCTRDLENPRTGRLRDEGEDADRKSTRLNSSHVSISYAVFCLKKKNNDRQLTAVICDRC